MTEKVLRLNVGELENIINSAISEGKLGCCIHCNTPVKQWPPALLSQIKAKLSPQLLNTGKAELFVPHCRLPGKDKGEPYKIMVTLDADCTAIASVEATVINAAMLNELVLQRNDLRKEIASLVAATVETPQQINTDESAELCRSIGVTDATDLRAKVAFLCSFAELDGTDGSSLAAFVEKVIACNEELTKQQQAQTQSSQPLPPPPLASVAHPPKTTSAAAYAPRPSFRQGFAELRKDMSLPFGKTHQPWIEWQKAFWDWFFRIPRK